ncbi:MAG: P22 phage major capsid protein family protein [Campylobacterota bacterium]|nr:P22 phage major capsid protein family protein [Campylobacterota bacterium]
MANTFVTAKAIAERALPHLVERIKMLPLIEFGTYNGTFRKWGDTIQVRKPQRGDTVDGSSDISSAYQDISDDVVEIVLNNQRAYPVKLTSKEKTLNLDDFTRQISVPAMTKLAEYANAQVLNLYKDIPYFYGTSGTTPSSLADIANARKILQDNLAPEGNRSFIFDSAAEAKLLQLSNFAEIDKAGTNIALRNALLGRVYNTLMASDSQVPTHTAGGYSALADVTITTGASGASSIVLTSSAGTSTAKLEEGDIFSIDGYQFVVTAQTAAASSGVVTAAIYPALPMAYGDFSSAAVTFPDVSAGGHVPNLMFNKSAFTIAMAPLAPADGVDSAVVSFNGFSIRVVRGYDMDNDINKLRFDILFGVKTLYPELATRVLG